MKRKLLFTLVISIALTVSAKAQFVPAFSDDQLPLNQPCEVTALDGKVYKGKLKMCMQMNGKGFERKTWSNARADCVMRLDAPKAEQYSYLTSGQHIRARFLHCLKQRLAPHCWRVRQSVASADQMLDRRQTLSGS